MVSLDLELGDLGTVIRAVAFATGAHAAVGQVRKYTGEPYIVHPVEVMTIVSEVTTDAEMLAAAALHDVVEDTGVSVEDIERFFSPRIAQMVSELTDASKDLAFSGMNRAQRKAIDRMALCNASNDVKTIKLADLISNTQSIMQHDHNFAKTYLMEKELLLDVLGAGDPILFNRAKSLLIESQDKLRQLKGTV